MNNASGYAQLAEALRSQIDSNTRLLGIVLDMWKNAGTSDGAENVMDGLIPITGHRKGDRRQDNREQSPLAGKESR